MDHEPRRECDAALPYAGPGEIDLKLQTEISAADRLVAVESPPDHPNARQARAVPVQLAGQREHQLSVTRTPWACHISKFRVLWL